MFQKANCNGVDDFDALEEEDVPQPEVKLERDEVDEQGDKPLCRVHHRRDVLVLELVIELLKVHPYELIMAMQRDMECREPRQEYRPHRKLLSIKELHERPKRILFGHKHQKECRYLTHPLAISNLLIVNAIRSEDVKKGTLSITIARHVEDMPAEAAVHIHVDLVTAVIVGGRLEQLLVVVLGVL